MTIYEHYINIVQNTIVTAPVKISSKYKLNYDKLVVEEIIKTCENQRSVKLIKDNVLSEDRLYHRSNNCRRNQ